MDSLSERSTPLLLTADTLRMAEPRSSLLKLPLPSPTLFGLRNPWSPVSTREIVDTIGSGDAGLWAVWRQRRLTPSALPTTWFKGRTLMYRLGSVLTWLAERHGSSIEEIDLWRECLLNGYGLQPCDDDEVRTMAYRLAMQADYTGVPFTANGWREYLGSLLTI